MWLLYRRRLVWSFPSLLFCICRSFWSVNKWRGTRKRTRWCQSTNVAVNKTGIKLLHVVSPQLRLHVFSCRWRSRCWEKTTLTTISQSALIQIAAKKKALCPIRGLQSSRGRRWAKDGHPWKPIEIILLCSYTSRNYGLVWNETWKHLVFIRFIKSCADLTSDLWPLTSSCRSIWGCLMWTLAFLVLKGSAAHGNNKKKQRINATKDQLQHFYCHLHKNSLWKIKKFC